ncbi:MAG: Rv1355c family protein, partial [Sphingobacteriales bacterium]
MESINRLQNTPSTREEYQPIFFRIHIENDLKAFDALLKETPGILLYDEIESHLREFIKCSNPAVKIRHEDYPGLIEKHLAGRDIRSYGVYVYYPWSRSMVHMLDEEEFVEVRTNRNRYKITPAEQTLLKSKKIGIVGLSVGQSIALTLAMERTCGELRLADFDTAELSNLNRIRTGLTNLGLKKTVIAAREIAEIDPFLKVVIYSDGLTEANMDSFFESGGKLDLLVEVCDGLDIKIICRYKARSLQIPVVMDTNDRGMLDVERFDLEPDRPVLHGLAEGLLPERIRDLTNEEKIPYILKIVGAETISTRLKASMIEVEQSINTWPQLASSVVLGGAVTTDVCRRIFLDQYHDSGRYYLDLDKFVGDRETPASPEVPPHYLPPKPMTDSELLALTEGRSAPVGDDVISEEQLNQLVGAAILAPSGGNCQPWKFVYRGARLYIFHDLSASYSFLDFRSLGANIALGAAVENLRIKAASLGLKALVSYEPLSENNPLRAVVSFTPAATTSQHELDRNWRRLINCTEEVWRAIYNSVTRCPQELRLIFRHIRACAEDRYGDFL